MDAPQRSGPQLPSESRSKPAARELASSAARPTHGATPSARIPVHAPVPLLDLPSSQRVERDWDALLPRRAYARWGKSLFEGVLLIPVVPVALGLMAVIALCNAWVFRDWRQVFFTQLRSGHRGRAFRIFKFRTMRPCGGTNFASWGAGQESLRVTRLGRVLRNTHLDELPQIVNILRGEMALIGPRPEMLEVELWARERVPGFDQRLALKPGITGWAQITQGYVGMDEAGYAAKLAANEHYRREFCLRLDLEILLRTATWMMRGKGWTGAPSAARGTMSGAMPAASGAPQSRLRKAG